jgi:hypothetical protein
MEHDAAIAAAWPDRWAKANADRPGASKRRNNLRKVWRAHLSHSAFVAANPDARCGNCANFKQMLFSEKHYCELDSDFHGYAITQADGVCIRHDRKAS